MKSDKFYSEFSNTILVLQGTVKAINTQPNGIYIEFTTATSHSILPKVSCNLGTQKSLLKI